MFKIYDGDYYQKKPSKKITGSQVKKANLTEVAKSLSVKIDHVVKDKPVEKIFESEKKGNALFINTTIEDKDFSFIIDDSVSMITLESDTIHIHYKEGSNYKLVYWNRPHTAEQAFKELNNLWKSKSSIYQIVSS